MSLQQVKRGQNVIYETNSVATEKPRQQQQQQLTPNSTKDSTVGPIKTFSKVIQPLRDPMKCSTPGYPSALSGFAQTPVHQ